MSPSLPNLLSFNMENRETIDQSIVIYDHPSKCAGISFRNLFMDSFTPLHVYGFGVFELEKLGPYLHLASQRLLLINHQGRVSPLGVCSSINTDKPLLMLSMIRDPFLRLISMYKLNRGINGQASSLVECVRQFPNSVPEQQRNALYVQYFGDGDIEKACLRATEDYFFIGLVEEFNLSWAITREILGLSPKDIPGRANTSPLKLKESEEEQEEARALFEKLHPEELTFYEQIGRASCRERVCLYV